MVRLGHFPVQGLLLRRQNSFAARGVVAVKSLCFNNNVTQFKF